MRRETALLKRILIWATREGFRLFRNAVGLAWVGTLSEGPYKLSFRNRDTQVVEIYDARPIRYGLCIGSSDLIGWRTLRITEDMVGKRVAQFCALEAKTENMSGPTKEQRNFLQQVAKSGGYAVVVREKDEILKFEEVGHGDQNRTDLRLRKEA